LGDVATVSVVIQPGDGVASAAPVVWAVDRLRLALVGHGLDVRQAAEMPDAGFVVQLCSGVEGVPQAAEAFMLAPRSNGVVAAGYDLRGLVYALLELADRVALADDAMAALRVMEPVVERPANRVRSVMRCFCSVVEDPPWFYDRAFWDDYLTMLVTQRFSRFSLTFGIGYDHLHEVTDSYFHFLFPFLFAVPGHDVHATSLSDEERDRNLAMLRYIGEATVARGLDFQLGI
jgi:hypothetical protein